MDDVEEIRALIGAHFDAQGGFGDIFLVKKGEACGFVVKGRAKIARGAKEVVEFVLKDIVAQGRPEERDAHTAAIGGVDAGAAEFKLAPGAGEERGEVEFVLGIEAAAGARHFVRDEAVDADDGILRV